MFFSRFPSSRSVVQCSATGVPRDDAWCAAKQFDQKI